MNGIGHIVVGATGTGKTTFVKDFLKRVPNKDSIFIYDVNNEYNEFHDEPFEPDEEIYLTRIMNLKNSVIVMEEATIFFSTKSISKQMKSMLVRKRHQFNYIFLNFHSLRQVPHWVYELCTHITVFKTNDGEKLVNSRFEDERLTKMFIEVNKSSNKHFNKTLKIY
jgi:Cdc6-like AAA superfamily ATPase